jgi:hypothetical protein
VPRGWWLREAALVGSVHRPGVAASGGFEHVYDGGMDVGAAPAGRGTRPVQGCADAADPALAVGGPAAGVADGPVAGLRAAAAAVGGVRVDSVEAEAALDAVLAARWAQAATVAVEADALARLEAVYPGGGLRGRDGEHAAVVLDR